MSDSASETSSGEAAAADNRQSPRRKMLLAASIALGQGQETLDAVVWDVSESGVRLRLDSATFLPDAFYLTIPKLGIAEEVQTVWRRGREVGVEFAQAGNDEPGESAATQARVEDLEARVKRLEDAMFRLNPRAST